MLRFLLVICAEFKLDVVVKHQFLFGLGNNRDTFLI